MESEQINDLLHIGYICCYNPSTGNGILMDSHKNAHIFNAQNSQHLFIVYEFITYYGEGLFVYNVISLEEYKNYGEMSHRIEKPMSFYRTFNSGSFISDNRQNYKLQEAEEFIIDLLTKDKKPLPIKIEKPINKAIDEWMPNIIKKVDYVSSHLQEIANSYTVNINIVHISKVGGDDRFYTDRNTEISYRDTYIDNFFAKSKTLDSSSGYSSNYDSPYKEGRDLNKEKEDKYNFIINYNKGDHISALLKEKIKAIEETSKEKARINSNFLYYWGISKELNYPLRCTYLDFSIRFIKESTFIIENKVKLYQPENKFLIDCIMEFNEGVHTIKDWEDFMFKH